MQIGQIYNKIIIFLAYDVETEKTYKSTKRLITTMSLLLLLFSLIMSILNIICESWLILSSTLFLSLAFLLCALICIISYKRKLIELIMAVTIILLFSFYAIIGGNDGVTIDWILLVPIAYMTLFGLKNGLIIGGYFWIFLFICLWTPVYSLLPFQYSNEIRLRFPLIYTCCFFVAIILGVRNKRLQISHLQQEQHLSDVLRTERFRAEQVSIDAVTSICRALDAKDSYTKAHSDHVATYSRMIAADLGWDGERLNMLTMAARVHDLGKIGIPDSILKKEGPLNADEFEIMKTHVALGADIVSAFSSMPELAVGAKYHHERFDGKGYSGGLSGTDIPLEGRIIALADAIDAMANDRVYRKKRSHAFILNELEKGAGKQFDPELIVVALGLIEKGTLSFNAT